MLTQSLRTLLDRYGRELLDDQERLQTLVRHRCAGHPVEAVLDAVRLGVIPGLLAAGFPLSGKTRAAELVQRFIAEVGGHSAEDAASATAAWLEALEPTPYADVDEEIQVTPAGPDWGEIASRLPSGGRIRLAGGVYRGQLRLPRGRFELVAEGDVMWESPADGPALILDGAWVEARGLGWRGGSGIDVNSGWLWLESCRFEGKRDHGGPMVFLVGRGALGSLLRCEMTASAESGLTAGDGACAHLESCRSYSHEDSLLEFRACCATVTRCLLEGPAPASVMVFGGKVCMTECQIRGAEVGPIVHGEGSHLTLIDCEVSRHDGSGVSVTQQGALVARGCTLENNQGPGVEVRSDSSAELTDCQIRGNAGYGLISARSAKVQLTRTSLRDNALGDRADEE